MIHEVEKLIQSAEEQEALAEKATAALLKKGLLDTAKELRRHAEIAAMINAEEEKRK